MPIEANEPDQDAAFWDERYASAAAREHGEPLAASPDLAAIVAAGHIPTGGVTLDLGCGAGTDAIFLASLGFRSIGLDLSSEAIKVARTRAADAGVMVDWREGSVLELPFSDASVHFAQDRGCFHHVPDAERERYADELTRVLVPGARFLLCGGRHSGGHEGEAADTASMDRVFASEFTRGAVVPYVMQSHGGSMDAYLVLFERR
ncbi:MAG: class I SAM-dependent methyltransferase [Chloroflexi bacterium]|nr:class I SAM-dependent methyltransferase [Chloroflexota bacterium]MDA1147532.1 class I SAM-dependent methyltransferase [Chloroflexota bacterium]